MIIFYGDLNTYMAKVGGVASVCRVSAASSGMSGCGAIGVAGGSRMGLESSDASDAVDPIHISSADLADALDDTGLAGRSDATPVLLHRDDLVDFPLPTDDDFEDVIETEERKYYIEKLADLKLIREIKIHCTSCDKHLGLMTRNVSRYRMHPLLRTLVCIACQEFYCSGEFDKGEDGSELYCRWCGQGGQVFCCAKCPIVFCEKCIKRNFGKQKINEIENNDNWQCFVCVPKTLWDLRAQLWSLILYCNYKTQQAQNEKDPVLRSKFLHATLIDDSQCCTKKSKSKPKSTEKKKVVNQKKTKPPDLVEEIKKNVVKPSVPRPVPVSLKRSSPAPVPYMPITPSPVSKKPKLSPKTQAKKFQPLPSYNGYMPIGYSTGMKDCYANVIDNDSLNLSLDNLTQGLDMSHLAPSEDNLVCTPDLPMPLEPLCEVTEEPSASTSKYDDDVQCLTPNVGLTPKPISSLMDPVTSLRPLLNPNALNNIIQMTENDVIVNKVTGGLKFKVDPSTLSSSKMYKLPDGRVFAININPKMPGGYSATIVSVNETDTGGKRGRNRTSVTNAIKSAINKQSLNKRNSQKTENNPDLSSLEWFKFNLYESIGLMEYVLKRLRRLQTTSKDMKTKTPQEIKELHHTFDQLLKTSEKRFGAVREDLNNEFKGWMNGKNCSDLITDDDDEDVQILPQKKKPQSEPLTLNSEPIFIDENSNDSVKENNADNNHPLSNVVCSVIDNFNETNTKQIENVETSAEDKSKNEADSENKESIEKIDDEVLKNGIESNELIKDSLENLDKDNDIDNPLVDNKLTELDFEDELLKDDDSCEKNTMSNGNYDTEIKNSIGNDSCT